MLTDTFQKHSDTATTQATHLSLTEILAAQICPSTALPLPLLIQ